MMMQIHRMRPQTIGPSALQMGSLNFYFRLTTSYAPGKLAYSKQQRMLPSLGKFLAADGWSWSSPGIWSRHKEPVNTMTDSWSINRLSGGPTPKRNRPGPYSDPTWFAIQRVVLRYCRINRVDLTAEQYRAAVNKYARYTNEQGLRQLQLPFWATGFGSTGPLATTSGLIDLGDRISIRCSCCQRNISAPLISKGGNDEYAIGFAAEIFDYETFGRPCSARCERVIRWSETETGERYSRRYGNLPLAWLMYHIRRSRELRKRKKSTRNHPAIHTVVPD